MLGFKAFIMIILVEILSSSPKYDMILIGANHEYRESCNDRKVYAKNVKRTLDLLLKIFKSIVINTFYIFPLSKRYSHL